MSPMHGQRVRLGFEHSLAAGGTHFVNLVLRTEFYNPFISKYQLYRQWLTCSYVYIILSSSLPLPILPAP